VTWVFSRQNGGLIWVFMHAGRASSGLSGAEVRPQSTRLLGAAWGGFLKYAGATPAKSSCSAMTSPSITALLRV
jgi:hypothetical protein